MPPRIVYFGTPLFSARVLTVLVEQKHNIVAIVTRPDRPQGRSQRMQPPAVKTTAEALIPDVPLLQPEKASSPEWASILASMEADFFVVVAYGEIIKQHLLDMPALGCINVHTSLLPKYRGAAPIQRALMAGETESGVTIMHMAPKMDAGDIIAQASVGIPKEWTFADLENALFAIGAPLLHTVLSHWEAQERKPQDPQYATLAPKVELEDCQIDWSRSAEEIHNLIRGVNPYPGAWCWWEQKEKKKRCKIWVSRITGLPVTQPVGTLVPLPNKKWGICCADYILQLCELQMEGKKRVDANAFMQGRAAERFL